MKDRDVRTLVVERDRIEELERHFILMPVSNVPNTVLRGRFLGENFQQCGGGRRIIRKKLQH